jgi:MerR family transcriptional regulator, repressor of the yfmOP operon
MAEQVTASKPLRIGEVAARAETTQRTVRYYEEIGLLPDSGDRPRGGYRTYTEADVERLRHILKLKDLLGVSLQQLKDLIEAEDARAALREEWKHSKDQPQRRRILQEALEHIGHQLALVQNRQDELNVLRDQLEARRTYLETRLQEVETQG